jgi:hypothetical protein
MQKVPDGQPASDVQGGRQAPVTLWTVSPAAASYSFQTYWRHLRVVDEPNAAVQSPVKRQLVLQMPGPSRQSPVLQLPPSVQDVVAPPVP